MHFPPFATHTHTHRGTDTGSEAHFDYQHLKCYTYIVVAEFIHGGGKEDAKPNTNEEAQECDKAKDEILWRPTWRVVLTRLTSIHTRYALGMAAKSLTIITTTRTKKTITMMMMTDDDDDDHDDDEEDR